MVLFAGTRALEGREKQTETGDTIRSSRLLEMSDKDRRDVEVRAESDKISMDGVAAAGEQQGKEKESDDSLASDTPSVI